MWKHHIITCLVIVLLAVPVYFLDRTMLKGGGGNWISLDLTGLFINTYICFMMAHVLISTVGLALIGRGLVLVHALSVILSIAVVVAGFFLYADWKDSIEKRNYDARMEQRKQYMNVIELISWRYIPDEKTPVQIVVRVHVSEAGRFAGGVTAYSHDEYDIPTHIFGSFDEEQRYVAAGDEFDFVFPIKIYNSGKPDEISITLHLFKNEPIDGPSLDDRTKIYTTEMKTEDDGHYYYAPLPPAEK
jgi:hypothetical protein